VLYQSCYPPACCPTPTPWDPDGDAWEATKYIRGEEETFEN